MNKFFENDITLVNQLLEAQVLEYQCGRYQMWCQKGYFKENYIHFMQEFQEKKEMIQAVFQKKYGKVISYEELQRAFKEYQKSVEDNLQRKTHRGLN